MQPKLIDDTMDGTWGTVSDKGWMTTAIFLEWFRWFIEYTDPTPQKPVLLILDGHSSHTKNIEVSSLAAENNVVIVCLPPHRTHYLQPLDVSVMKPLSDAYSAIVNDAMRSGERLIEADIARMVSRAWETAATEKNIKSGFRASGICPFNRNIFSPSDFAPAELSNRRRESDAEEEVTELLNRSISGLSFEDEPEYIDTRRNVPDSPVHLPLDSSSENESPQPSSSSSAQPSTSTTPTCQPLFWAGRPFYQLDDSSDADLNDEEKVTEEEEKEDEEEANIVAASSWKQRYVTRMLPEKYAHKRVKFTIPLEEIDATSTGLANRERRGRPEGKTDVISSRTYIQELEEQEKNKK